MLVKPASIADAAAARFFFHQVKNVSCKPWNAKDLTKRKRTKSGLGNSVLGKLVLGTHKKPFTPQLEAILIVATCGFSLPQQNADQKYQELHYENLAAAAQLELRKAIETELGHEVDIAKLRLLKPSLGVNFVADVVSAIVSLVELKMPGVKTNALYIYRGLIDELHRRGVITHDYQSWEKLLHEKALSGAEIERTLKIYSSAPQADLISAHAGDIASKLALSLPERIRFAMKTTSYSQRRRFATSLDQMRVNDDLRVAVEANWTLVEDDKILEFATEVKLSLGAETIQYLESFEGLSAALACEIILRSVGD